MSSGEPENGEDYLSPKDIRQWAQQEIKDAAKALDLRTREVAELAAAYSAGELTPAEATERYFKYQRRWGEALPGATVGDGIPDEQILANIDRARSEHAELLQKRAARKDQGHVR